MARLDSTVEPAHEVRRRSAFYVLAEDFGAWAILAVLALGIGLLINVARGDPLPLRYASAAARLQVAVNGLSGDQPAALPMAGISLAAFRQLADSRAALILDARPDGFYREGHVPGAFNLARETFAADYTRLRPRLQSARGLPIVVYCADADCPDAVLVAGALKQLGFREVVDYPPGWEGWTQAGLPEEKQARP